METLTAMPARFTAGETVAYTLTLSDLPASSYGWVLFVYLGGASELAVGPLTVAADGTAAVELPAGSTAALSAGSYRWQETVKENVTSGSPATYSGRVFTWNRGAVAVEFDLSQAASGSALTWEAQLLAALKAKVAGRLTADQETLQVEGTSIARIPFELAERLITKYQTIVDLQNNPAAAIGSVEVNFGTGTPFVPGMPLPWGGR